MIFLFFQESTVKSTLMTAKAIPATMEPALTRSTGTSVPVNLATQVSNCDGRSSYCGDVLLSSTRESPFEPSLTGLLVSGDQ